MKTNPATLIALALTLTSCGPKYSSPDAPATACRNISKAQFDAAVTAGAARAVAKISTADIVSMNTGSGVKHCSSFKGSKQICRRPNDFVIQYTLPNDQVRFVIIPKDREYRLNMNRKPIPCEVVTP
jgi:hypothetical protein